jgi:hypothetical protein
LELIFKMELNSCGIGGKIAFEVKIPADCVV